MKRFIPSGDGVIEMNDNVVYLKSAANSGLPVAKDYIYEELPGDYANMTSMAVLENEEDLDDSSHPKGAEGQTMLINHCGMKMVTMLMMTSL